LLVETSREQGNSTTFYRLETRQKYYNIEGGSVQWRGIERNLTAEEAELNEADESKKALVAFVHELLCSYSADVHI
jgi:hypothetical protein